MAGTRVSVSLASWITYVLPRLAAFTLSTMTFNSTSGCSSILEGGKLKPGIYKIQNINTEAYVDVEVATRELCGRLAQNLGEGRGFVCRHLLSLFIYDDKKWEIRSSGAGYTIQMVSAPMLSDGTSVIVC